jgi:general nucleoside transport system permease protein
VTKIKFEDREGTKAANVALSLALALVLGILAISLVFLACGLQPFSVLADMFMGAWGSDFSRSDVAVKALPLILIAVGLCVPYRAKFWNVGAESQLLMGAVAGAVAGLGPLSSLPGWLGVPLIFLAGFAAGAAWGAVPALLKQRFGVNEVISTLMLNYVASNFVYYLVTGPLRGAGQKNYPRSDELPSQLSLALIGDTNVPWLTVILTLAAAALVFLLVTRSKFGYEVRVIGENPEAARYAGIRFTKTTVLMMVVSGGLAGVAGANEILANTRQVIEPSQISSNFGFTAIIVAWLGRLNPLGAIVSGIFFAGILVGGDAIQGSPYNLPAVTVQVVNGILFIFLISGDFLARKRIRIVRKAKLAGGAN